MQQKQFFVRAKPGAPRARAAMAGLAMMMLMAIVLPGAAVAATAVAADAQDDVPHWSLGGFGSVGAVHSDQRDADFTSNILKANGAGYSRAWSADIDSRLGVQLDGTLNKQWSAVLQLISEQAYDGSYQPVVEWANIKYQASPELSVRVGRIALPIFMAADYRKAGYALPWVRVPVELYGSVPLTNSDGIDATYRWSGAGVKHVLQAFAGRTQVHVTANSLLKARRLAGLSYSVERGAFSARGSYLRSTLSLDLAQRLFDDLSQFSPDGAALARKYVADNQRVRAHNLALGYDPGQWFVLGEIGRLNTRSYLGDTTAMYASAGYRLANLTPYLSYSRIRSNGATDERGLDAPGAQAQALNQGLNAVLKTIPVQRTLSAGLRWDFQPDLALKLQYDRVRPQCGSSGTLITVQPGFVSGSALNLVSVALDFVF